MILDPNLHCWEALNNNFVEFVEQKNQTPTRQKMVHFHIDSRLTEALLSRKHVDFQIYTVGRTFWQQTCSQGGINLDPRNFWALGFFFSISQSNQSTHDPELEMKFTFFLETISIKKELIPHRSKSKRSGYDTADRANSFVFCRCSIYCESKYRRHFLSTKNITFFSKSVGQQEY